MIKDFLKSPLLHFLGIGAGIFLLYAFLNREANHPDGFDIHISEDQQIQIALAHQRNFGDLPDQATMDKLIAAEVKSEIYYREALRLGLDENDEIIRRRLKQKYEFLNKDKDGVDNIEESALLDYYEKNKQHYLKPATYTFEHYYFNPDKRADSKAAADAYVENPALGSDPFHISSPKTKKTLDDLRNDFGLGFVETISQAKASDELLVVSSGFGYHAVRLISIVDAEVLPFDDIRDQLIIDYRTFLRSERNKEAYQELKEEYNIEIETLQ